MSTDYLATRGSEYFGTISVAMVTPFDVAGKLDIDASVKLAAHLVDHGVDSLVLSGTTGEAPTTTKKEKLDLLKAVKAAVGERAKIVVGAGTNNTATSVDLAQCVAQAGADALLVVTPYYSKPSQEGIYQHFYAIAHATELPVCVYDIPPRSVIPIEPDTMRRLAEIDTVKAVKDAKGNIAEATSLICETGLAWYSGDDPLNLPWLSVGATGFISVIGHVAPQLLREMYTHFASGTLDAARAINAQLTSLTSAQARLGGVSFAKAALRMQGIEVGDPRLPIIKPNEKQLEELRRDLEKAGVL
ncbi:Dihydrodipicolinate synthase [Corynebacterium kutscheri]|uniref:4-hydroxy-tetrahydrodipicolinate synthase n=1 Tax=Corynebacterium kutscheri TaxID=35755 RepID=A0A0F6QZZ6_9CORY|nr:4-hydroxy-tetrahydrodipicolinate synthase [Corynebacterium kutscheri]AKE41427.1 4-hydroxy-tetrahydrodipicolinate synthase [Corynebacterium kutscheri]VEH08704.1 Dihydrodipicolinate synthase [Corynebacterium kutscheri]VEH09751.1 Dihydrodipicolinate synthase [Corynebacterium kutscheri]VEH79834.1 Dihydrodipicolinate synthase [Corynebacterium kutscheri]